MEEDSSTELKTWQIYCFVKRGLIRKSPERVFLSERKGKMVPFFWAEDRKHMGTNSEKSGTRNLAAESIISRAESMGGCVKLMTISI